jgi:hypothetical protein
MTKRGLQLIVCAALACNEADEATDAEGSGGGSSGMPEWEDGAPGATCPEEYDPDRVYVAMQEARYHSWLWVVRDLEEQEVECSYKWEGNDFLDAIVHPGRRAVLLSMETRDGFELRLPAPRAVHRVEASGDPSEFIWDLVPAPNTDVTLFEIADDPQTHCGEALRRWWPDATVMFSCFSEGWQDETGMPRFNGHTFDFDGNETMFTLSGSRVIVDDLLYDLVALEQQGFDYVPVRLDYGPEYPEIRILSARSLSAGTSDAILVETWTNCTDCANPNDLVLRRLLLSGDAIVEERDYIWPHEVELEAEQVVLDGEGRWVAHLQEPAPDGRMFDKVIRGELDGSETVLLEAPSIVDFETNDPSAIRIGRVFTGM